ncbi:TIGR03885 family FMN-dependent LLM class oxidoreductase [Rhizobium sp. RCC_161_2]|uniref:TIGR03885 family FMN-dependent LLM class oxidoreductase n=1 Tax=Rhizobium sp. RCC_161_2 TaxID=3239219 RepID=UPI003525BED0
MVLIGYHASHEQFAPRELIDHVRLAEQAGFGGVMSSDHFAPWSKRQGQSGFAWTWLGAAMQATTLPFGLITVPSGWRYHPAITAQASATLAQLFPGRFPWMAVGSGQALNEHVVGAPWPDKSGRNARLLAGVEIMRALWAGETIDRSEPIKIDDTKLYTLPDEPPRIIAGALSVETARWAGSWADGLITVSQAREKLGDIVEAFRLGGGQGKPLYLQVHISHASSYDIALANAFDQWRNNAVTADMAETLRTPQEFDNACSAVRPEDMHQHVRISSDIGRHVAWLEEDAAMGFEQIYVHNVGRNQREFIESFGNDVLPAFR